MEGYLKIYEGDRDRSAEEVDNIFKMVDKNNSGSIDYTEWVMATINR